LRLKPKPTLIFDIETDGLLHQVTRVHCIAVMDFETGQIRRFRRNKHEDTIQKGLDYLDTADTIIGHNIIAFDIPVLEMLYDWSPVSKIDDTMVHSRLRFPDIKETDYRLYEQDKMPGQLIGRHGLEAWGYRLDMWKGDYKENKEQEGLALGYMKGSPELHHHVWGTWNEEMDDYCVQDIEVTAALWRAVQLRDTSSLALRVQHMLADLMARQELSGFPFQRDRAEQLRDELEEAKELLSVKIEKEFPGRFVPKKMMDTAPIGRNVNGPDFPDFGFTEDEIEDRRWFGYPTCPEKDGPKWKFKTDENGKIISHQRKYKGVWFTEIKWQEFNPRSRQQITNRLQDMGWDPEDEDYTEKGNVKANDVILRRIADTYPVAWHLADIMAINKLLGQLADGANAWLKLERNGFIHASTNPCGAVTTRATHSYPNIAQIPSVKKKSVFVSELAPVTGNERGIVKPDALLNGDPVLVGKDWQSMDDGEKVTITRLGLKGGWGYECRSLFTVLPGFKMVGSDLAGIELRCLAHRMAAYDGGAYGRVILEGDIHSYNQEMFELDTRDQSKTTIYATLYGAGDEKIGSISEPLASPAKQKKVGKLTKKRFQTNLPAFGKVMRDTQQQARRKYIEGLDGRRLFVRSKHAALNTDLQGMGATIANYWVMFILEFLEDEGLEYGWDADFTFLAWVHDEVQIACREGLEDLVKEICVEAATEAGRFLNFQMPVDASAVHGTNWAETH
jgi:hypothetical protein